MTDPASFWLGVNVGMAIGALVVLAAILAFRPAIRFVRRRRASCGADRREALA